MKKSLSALFFVLVTMAVLVTNVLAAPAQANTNVTLQRVTYERSGIILLFDTSGLSKADLKNVSFTAHSDQWNVTCNFLDDTTNVRCQVPQKLSMFAGEGFHGTLAGFQFVGNLPAARTFSPVADNIPIVAETPIVIDTPLVTETSTTTDIAVTPVETETPTVTDTPNATDTPVVTNAPITTNDVVVPEMPSECSADQMLVHDFEWSGTVQSVGYDGDILLYNTYTFTSSGSINPSQWDWYVQNMQDLGYTVEQTGEHCE